MKWKTAGRFGRCVSPGASYVRPFTTFRGALTGPRDPEPLTTKVNRASDSPPAIQGDNFYTQGIGVVDTTISTTDRWDPSL